MINLTTSIKEAFFQRNRFVPYYDLLNTFFQSDRIGAIHDAKSIAVIIRCTQLYQTYGFDYTLLYETLKEIFSEPNSIRLSGLVDLSCFDCFMNCVKALQAKYDTPTAAVEIEQLIFKQKLA